MKNVYRKQLIQALLLMAVSAVSLYAQTSPWERAAGNAEISFTGPLARSMMLIATVLCGIYFAYSQGQGKEKISGLVFGGAMILQAAQFIGWLYS